MKAVSSKPIISIIGYGAVGQTLSRLCRMSGVGVNSVSDFSGYVFKDYNRKKNGQQQYCIPVEDLEALEQAKQDALASNQGKGGEPALLDLIRESPLLRSRGFVGLEHKGQDGIDELLTTHVGENTVFCDTSASEATTPLLMAALDKSQKPVHALRSIVLANKKPLTQSYSQFECLTAQRDRVRFEATCGAGLPTMTALRRIVDSGDNIVEAIGALSGTLGYIMSGLDANRPFSEVVAEAKKLGFTEPDPRDDLSGTDVARKALIIARCAGMSLEMKDIDVEPLFPKEWASLSVDEFMAKLPELDPEMADKVKKAESKGSRLRYAAVVKHGGESPKVGLIESPYGSPLASLVGTDNLLSFETEFYSSMAGAAPLVIQGPGAGLQVTAAGVLSDVFDLAGSSLKSKWSK